MNYNRKLYLKILFRSAIAVAIIIPVSFLYDFALTDLTEQQVAVQEKTISIFLSLILVIFAGLVWIFLAPIRKVIEKIFNEEESTDTEAVAAERRALVSPYYGSVFAVICFFGISLIINLNMYRSAGLAFDSLIYLIASAATTALLLGIGSFYLSRPPLKEVLLLIIENHPVKETRPPFFFPVSLKITTAFALIAALSLAFSGMYSSVISKNLLAGERHKSQKSETELAAALIEISDGDTTYALPKKEGRALIFIDSDGEIIGTPKTRPPDNILSELIESDPGKIIIDNKNNWSWVAVNVNNSEFLLASGREPVLTSDISGEIIENFLKASLVALFLAVSVGYLIARDISTTLKELSRNAVKIAEGASDVSLVAGNEDETGILARAFNNMSGVLLSQLKDELEKSHFMIESIRQAIDTLSPMSQRLVEFSTQQSAASAEQSSAAQETAASCQEVATISDQISKTSGDIVQSADTALSVARSGRDKIDLTQSSFNDIGDKVIRIIDVVQRLSEHSKSISGVVEVIEEISDQINLLSLNASLEAAGAEQYGQRFGVVAEEVRNLANRSTDSAGKITVTIEKMQELINDTMSQTNEGADAVLRGKDMLEEVSFQFTSILDASSEASEMIKQINLITLQQTTASEQMTQAMTEVKDTAGRTSDNAKELEETIKAIDEIITELKAHVDMTAD
jgi:methyl-accepting chemotaxis protein